ncbi:MAG: beta-mannosidase [Candidatus Hydrogenedentota bacterium]
MSRLLPLVTAVLSLFIGIVAASADPVLLELSPQGDWRLQSSSNLTVPDGGTLSSPGVDTSTWHRAIVPGTVLGSLAEAGVYPDPYYGLNLKKIPGYKDSPWLRMDESSPFYPTWWYRIEFTLPSEFSGKNVRLHLDGINYRANVWLNGRKIAGDDTVIGMFRRFEFDVTAAVAPNNTNCLAIEVSAPGKVPDQQYRTKQLEATTGWDDHNPQPPDLNMGVWRNVYVSATGPVILRHPYVLPKLEVPSLAKAELTVSVQAANVTDEPVTAVISGTIEQIRVDQEVTLNPREVRWVEFTPASHPGLSIDNPRVWWPYPLGPQELYPLAMEARVGDEVSDKAATRFGIREATTFINQEGWRGYRVNGHPILIRGGAWMTNDMLLRFTERRDRALVRYAREAGLNMLRSEGFSIRETDQFYDICDELGVMVTQQLFGRSIPDEPLAIANIEDTMLRIRNHPSLVHFLGHDETFPTENLDAAYKDLIAKYIPDRTYQPHSGAFDVEERFKTGGTRTGTRELWTYADPTRYYRTSYPERAWGFAQSGGIGGVISVAESVKRMIPEADRWPLWSEAMSFHTVTQGAEFFGETIKAMNARYGEPKDIDDFCLTGQVLNYECARAMFEAYGRNKFEALGITTWKYDAAWPAVMTWHYIDWYLLPTGAYYGARKACEPLHVQYSYDDNSVWAVSTVNKAMSGLKVQARVLDMNMKERAANEAVVQLEANGKAKAFDLTWPQDITTTFFVVLSMSGQDNAIVSENVYWLSTVKDEPGEMKDDWRNFALNAKSVADLTLLRKLPKAKLDVGCAFEQKGGTITGTVRLSNVSDVLAFFVMPAIVSGPGGPEVAPSYWSDNDFCLLPGQKKELVVEFSESDLGGAKPALRVSGWNLDPVAVP